MGKLPALAEKTSSITLPFERGKRPLVAFPEKRPLMVMTTIVTPSMAPDSCTLCRMPTTRAIAAHANASASVFDSRNTYLCGGTDVRRVS